MDSILIYTPAKTGRIRYVFRLVFEDILKVPYELTTDLEEFQSSDLPKFIYGEQAYSDDLFFKSSGLLFERGIEIVDLEAFDFDGLKAFFPVYGEDTALPFDVFSAIFYLVSRYEEHLPFVKDKHGRFTAHLSISAKLHILGKPIVNVIKRVSTPGRRVYAGSKAMPRVKDNLGVAIMTTPKGVMTARKAARLNVGGEVLCYVW